MQPPHGLAGLRRFSEAAEDLLAALDTAADLAWTLEGELEDVQDELAQLEDHRQVLGELAALHWLADESASLTPLVRSLRRSADDLRALADELLPEEDAATWRSRS